VSARLAAALGAVVVLAGCFLHRSPKPNPREGEWGAVRDAATRRALLYDGLKHRATGTATHLSLEVREARARRLASWFGWTAQELEDQLAQEQVDAATGEEFVLSFYTADGRSNDLDAPRSVWRIAVKADGADMLASRVTSIDRDATIVGLYPYVGPFEVVYRVFVPFAPGGPLAGREFTLEVASALGRLAMDFGAPNGTLKPQQPAPPP
jgi:hypothetical protein